MSVEIMGKVWGMALPHQQKMVLLSLADHADHEGKRIYPSLGLIAWKTDYSVRQVRRIVAQLVDQKILIRRKSAAGKPSLYEINMKAAPQKPSFKQVLETEVGQDDLGNDVLGSHDLGQDDLGHDVLGVGHGDLPTPDIAMSPKPSVKPSLTNTPPSPPTKLSPRWLMDQWNEICGQAGFPRKLRLTNDLIKKIKLRLLTYPDEEFWLTVLRKMAAIPFYRGVNDRQWQADLDWLVKNDETAQRIYERNENIQRGSGFVE